ncbi:hypothetical protein PITC_020660 [Penicillium italicum]|uniref:Uncharacterized protein n=1 Tax=Penicillium italicum TaxID=40296 RepID=A0A0A2KS42_PENIT|nr:hypothetical protein PITC_020660 [Penicillium italicum]
MDRIDIHTPCVLPSYREYCLQSDLAGRGHPDGIPAIPMSPSKPKHHTISNPYAKQTVIQEWSAEAHIKLMN